MPNVSLSLFLAIALISLKLWALPFFMLLAMQTLVMALFAVFVTFRALNDTR